MVHEILVLSIELCARFDDSIEDRMCYSLGGNWLSIGDNNSRQGEGHLNDSAITHDSPRVKITYCMEGVAILALGVKFGTK